MLRAARPQESAPLARQASPRPSRPRDVRYFRYRSTNCYFIESASGGLLAFDAGWPCSLGEYRRSMKAIGLRLEDVRWAMVSHMHMDHAGLIGEFLERGIECFAFELQREAVDEMER